MPTKSADKQVIVDIPAPRVGELSVWVVGTQPYVANSMSEKASHELLMPAPPKNRAAKAANLKHDPIAEFRNSCYRIDDGPTLLGVLAGAFKAAMMTAALDVPGLARTQIGRLVWVKGQVLSLYGSPRLFMAIVRSADINHTPDVRTRALLPQWACQLTVGYMQGPVTHQGVVNLLAQAGLTAGVGDWRPERGRATYGSFRVEQDPQNPELREILRLGRAAQAEALELPEPWDAESEKLLSWFITEGRFRGNYPQPVALNPESAVAVEVARVKLNGRKRTAVPA